MASGIYAVVHIGHLKLFICDVSELQKIWPPILAQLDKGTHPNAALQAAWNAEAGNRHFTFHTKKDLADNREIIEIENLLKQ